MIEKANNNEARREILNRIREQLAASKPFDAVHQEHHGHQVSRAITNAPLVSASDLQKVPLIERFQENLVSIGGNCTVVKDEQEAAQTVQAIIEKTKACGIAVSDSPLVKKVCGLLKTKAVLLENVLAAELFEFDLGITGAQWAIAETGTLVLESEKERHRLSSLVPPVHVCLIESKQIRQTMGEVLNLLNEKEPDELSRTITFITGASRTSDIELTLAIGVHGPAELHVIIVDKPEPPVTKMRS